VAASIIYRQPNLVNRNPIGNTAQNIAVSLSQMQHLAPI